MGNLNLKFSNSNEYLIVSGSNISLLNGIYVKSGTVSGKPKYVKTPAVNYLFSGNFQIIIQGEFPIVWGITTVSYNGYFYYGDSSYASPDLVPAWGIGQNGSGNISIKVTAIGKTSIKKQNTGSGIFSMKKSPKKTYKAFFPIMGNHDYDDINKTGIDHLNYFPFLSKLYGNTSGKSKYYDIKLGPCHFFILDSDPVCGGYFSNGDPTNTTYAAGKGDGNPATTSNATYNAAQKAWYNAAIAASTSKFKFTLFHHPSYDYTLMAYSNGWRHDYADFVLHGHYHNFQRYYEVHNSKQVKYIITGNGGRSLYDFDTNAPNYIFRNNTTYGFTRFDVYENGIRVRHYSLAYQASSFSVIYDETVGTLDVFSFTFAAVADWGKGNGGGTINAPSSLAAHTDFPGNYYINLISQEIRNQNINYIFGVGDLTYVGLTYLYVGYKLNASTPVFIDENIGRFFSDYITDYKGIYSDGKVNSNLLSIGTNSIFYGNQQYEYSI